MKDELLSQDWTYSGAVSLMLIPQIFSSIFTRRDKLLQYLTNTLATGALPDQGPSQKRFIIFGLGRSGKTQCCCKFAQDNRQRF